MLCRVTHSADRAFVFATLAMVPERDFNALRGSPGGYHQVRRRTPTRVGLLQSERHEYDSYRGFGT
jgi:hypothetical protein